MTRASPPLKTLFALSFLLGALLMACLGIRDEASEATPTPLALAPTAPPATPTPPPPPTPLPPVDPSSLEAAGVELVRRAFDGLMDFYIRELAPEPLLQAAWREARAEALRLGVDVSGLAFSPPPGRDEGWQAFEAAYVALAERVPQSQSARVRFAALGAMTRSLNDCHAFFLPPARTEALTELRRGSGSVGVGVELAPVRPPYVREVATGGPAQSAGVRPGDHILRVDGRDVTQLGIEAISEMLRGAAGSVVAVDFRRPATGEQFSVSLSRAFVRVPPAEGRILDDGTGYIRIRAFASGSQVRDAIDAAVASFEEAGVRAWVIDLRDNPGGERDLLLYGRFVGAATAERTLLRGGELETLEGGGEPYPDRPLAVLVNAGTASVSEIFAAMLQDHGRARVFGTTTARCAGFVWLDQLPDGSTVGVTIAHSLTPLGGAPLYQTGVIPDERVVQTQEDLALGRDPVLERALRWLRTVSH